jgi:hypothetical protein
METLAQPYTSSADPFASLNSSTAGLGFQIFVAMGVRGGDLESQSSG